MKMSRLRRADFCISKRFRLLCLPHSGRNRLHGSVPHIPISPASCSYIVRFTNTAGARDLRSRVPGFSIKQALPHCLATIIHHTMGSRSGEQGAPQPTLPSSGIACRRRRNPRKKTAGSRKCPHIRDSALTFVLLAAYTSVSDVSGYIFTQLPIFGGAW
jgi:hypothetical protein